jgi:hypothetical protein
MTLFDPIKDCQVILKAFYIIDSMQDREWIPIRVSYVFLRAIGRRRSRVQSPRAILESSCEEGSLSLY